jgi:hypothetical protein
MGVSRDKMRTLPYTIEKCVVDYVYRLTSEQVLQGDCALSEAHGRPRHRALSERGVCIDVTQPAYPNMRLAIARDLLGGGIDETSAGRHDWRGGSILIIY